MREPWTAAPSPTPVQHARRRAAGALLIMGVTAGLAFWWVDISVKPAQPAPTSPQTERWESFTNGDDIAALAFDAADGSLWAATSGGAVHWDLSGGHIKITAADGLCANDVTRLLPVAGVGVWFGTNEGGACRLAPDGTWEYLNTTNDLPLTIGTEIGGLARDASGAIWVATADSLSRRAAGAGRWERMDLPRQWSNPYIDDLAAHADGSVWVVADGVGRRSPDGTWRVWATDDGLPQLQAPHIAVDAAGTVWLKGVFNSPAYRLGPDGRWETSAWQEGGPMGPDPAGGMWFATGAGPNGEDLRVAHLSAQGRLSNFVFADADTSPGVIAADGSGGAWIGTDSGLIHLSGAGDFAWRRTGDTLPDNLPADVAVSPDGTVWSAHNTTVFTGVAHREVDGTWRPFPMPEDVMWPREPGADLKSLRSVQDLAVDTQGTAWLAADGVFSLDPDGSWVDRTPPRLAGEKTDCASAAPDGSVWFGTTKGIWIHSAAGAWQSLSASGFGPDRSIYGIAFGPQGEPWAVTETGISHRGADGSWHEVAMAQVEELGLYPLVGSIAVDTAGDAWLPGSNGFARLSPAGRFEVFRELGGLQLSPGYVTYGSVATDQRTGTVWESAVRLAAIGPEAFAMRDGGLLHRAPGEQWTLVNPWDGLGGLNFSDLAVDPRRGDLWVALFRGGVVRRATGDEASDGPSTPAYLPLAVP